MNLRTALIERLDEARAGLESVLPRLDPARQIYPNWTLKQMLDHIAGWDDAVAASLRAHMDGQTPSTPADKGIDDFNARTVSACESLAIEHSWREFQASRLLLKEIIQTMTDEKIAQPLVVPWGPTGTVSEIIEIFAEHEEIHTADILRWLENPDQTVDR
jgi:hypothetical protein